MRNTLVRWGFVAVIALLMAAPVVYYRYCYTHSKRLREVTPGVLYRSGCMTAPGFREAINRLKIKTIINLQEEAPDPELPLSYLGGGSQRESELCRELGVHFIVFEAGLVPRPFVPTQRPAAIDQFLRIMDDPANYPVLLHCKAGLHRTGVLVAVYRMEYDGWTPQQAIREMKDNGFGEFTCSAANDYITQYILTYERGQRRGASEDR